MDPMLERKLNNLRNNLRKMDSAIVAFSGGVDSSFLMRVCREELGERAVAVTFLPDKYPSSELSLAKRIAKVIGARHIAYPQLSDKSRDPRQSGTCKGKMYSSLKSLAAELKVKHVLDGSHKDDEYEGAFSFLAARQAGIRSPLLESSLTKAEIRMLAKELGLPNWDSQPSGGKYVSLRKMESARRFLSSLGVKDCLLLLRGRELCIASGKSEVSKLARRMEAVRKRLIAYGFSDVVLKLA